MASTINASNGAVPGLISTGDNSGVLQLQTNNGVTAVTIDTSQNVAVVGNLTFNNGKAAVTTGKAIAMAMIFGF
jgi:hypothetical protein